MFIKTNDKSRKLQASSIIIGLFMTACMVGITIFILYLPDIWWDVNWGTLFAIASNKTKDIQIINKISQIAESLGLTTKSIRTWAIERIFICIAIGLALIILICIIFKPRKKRE